MTRAEARHDAIRLHDWLRREPQAMAFPFRIATMDLCLHLVEMEETLREYERKLQAMESDLANARSSMPRPQAGPRAAQRGR